MKKPILLLISLFLFGSANCQNLESIQKKFASKVCDCIGEIETYTQLKPKIDKCYDSTMNFIFNGATSEEVKFYAGPGNLKLVSQNLEQNLKADCPSVKKVIEQYTTPKKESKSYPTNFSSQDFRLARKRPSDWNGRIIAFDAKVMEVASIGPNKPYLKVQLDGGEEIWVGSMANSKFETVGNNIRLLGYFSTIGKSGPQENLNNTGYHVLAFGVVDLKTNQMASFPGSEVQIREWANGKIPEARK